MKLGTFTSEIVLSNPVRPELTPLTVFALVDTGALHLCLPEHLALQLGLQEIERREVTFADGRKRSVPYVGPVQVAFGLRRCFVGAMVLGTEALLGAIPLEDMDLVVDPARRRLIPNPDNPNIPGSVAKQIDSVAATVTHHYRWNN